MKKITPWNKCNREHSNDTLIVKIKRKLFPQHPIPLLQIIFKDTLHINQKTTQLN